MRIPCLSLLIVLASGVATIRAAGPSKDATDNESPWQRVATFSILGYDPDTGEVGGAVQSRVFCVGNGVIGPRQASGRWPRNRWPISVTARRRSRS